MPAHQFERTGEGGGEGRENEPVTKPLCMKRKGPKVKGWQLDSMRLLPYSHPPSQLDMLDERENE